MRFNSLPNPTQNALAQSIVELISGAPDNLLLPVLPTADWLAAFRKFNTRLDRDYTPTSSGLFEVAMYLESQLTSTEKCLSCGNNF
jgi:hypothetical protein